MKVVLFYLLFLFLPVVFCPFLFNSSELAKVVFLRLLVEILLGFSWLGILSRFSALFREREKNWLPYVVIGYLLWVFLTSLAGKSWPRSLFGNYFRQQGLFTLFHFVFLFLTIFSLGREIKEEVLASAISGGAFLASAYALFQALPFLLAGSWPPGVSGTFGNPNFLGGYLAITLPFVVYLAQKKRVLGIFLLPQILAIIFSGSRTAILLLLTFFFFYLLLFFKKKRWFLPILALVLIGFSLPLLRQPHSVEDRGAVWEKGLLATRQRLVFGWGLENFEYAFESVLVPEKDIGLSDLRVDKAHNEFLEVLVASGIVGLGFYLLIITWSLRLLLAEMKTPGDKNRWLALLISLLFFLGRSQVNPVSIAEQALFWLLLGLAVGSSETVTLEEKWRGNLFLSLVICFCLIFVAIFNLRSLWADYMFRKGIEAERIDRKEAEFFFKKASEIFPWEEVYQLKARAIWDKAIGTNDCYLNRVSTRLDY